MSKQEKASPIYTFDDGSKVNIWELIQFFYSEESADFSIPFFLEMLKYCLLELFGIINMSDQECNELISRMYFFVTVEKFENDEYLIKNTNTASVTTRETQGVEMISPFLEVNDCIVDVLGLAQLFFQKTGDPKITAFSKEDIINHLILLFSKEFSVDHAEQVIERMQFFAIFSTRDIGHFLQEDLYQISMVVIPDNIVEVKNDAASAKPYLTSKRRGILFSEVGFTIEKEFTISPHIPISGGRTLYIREMISYCNVTDVGYYTEEVILNYLKNVRGFDQASDSDVANVLSVIEYFTKVDSAAGY